MHGDGSTAALLRSQLNVHSPAVAMAAHNPLAAKLAANAGFDAIWGSGFELAASYAVPDANILSMGIHLDMMRAITEVQEAPVIADIDTGFGNAVNVAYVTPHYAAAGVAAIVSSSLKWAKLSNPRSRARSARSLTTSAMIARLSVSPPPSPRRVQAPYARSRRSR